MKRQTKGIKGFRRPLIPCTKVHRKKKGAYRRFTGADRRAILKVYAGG